MRYHWLFHSFIHSFARPNPATVTIIMATAASFRRVRMKALPGLDPFTRDNLAMGGSCISGFFSCIQTALSAPKNQLNAQGIGGGGLQLSTSLAVGNFSLLQGFPLIGSAGVVRAHHSRRVL
jgi:hypothetical protein